MKKGFLILCLASVSATAFAHSPSLQCKHQNTNITCEGGFSDGSSAFGVIIEVKDYDDKVLFSGKLDKSSKITFGAPKGDFYVKFDAGPGHIIEVDHTDIP